MTPAEQASAAAAEAAGVVPWSIVLFGLGGLVIVMCGVAGVCGWLDRLRRPDHPSRDGQVVNLLDRYPADHLGWERLRAGIYDPDSAYDQEADPDVVLNRSEEQR